MDHKNKVDWCLTKASKGLKRGQPDIEKAKSHLLRAERNLEATAYLKQGGFTTWCAPTIFYSVYHCFLGVLMKEGYYSENQDCTFSVIALLIEEGKYPLKMAKLKKVMGYGVDHELRGLRERFQYGTEETTSSSILNEMQELAQEILVLTKEDCNTW